MPQKEERKMKGYKEIVHVDGQVNEPVAAYSASAPQETAIPGLSDEILNELLRQKDEVKLMLIHKLAESMMKNSYAEKSVALEETGNKDLMEAKRRYVQKKYGLSESLTRLIGVLPQDVDWKDAKLAYLEEKYGKCR